MPAAIPFVAAAFLSAGAVASAVGISLGIAFTIGTLAVTWTAVLAVTGIALMAVSYLARKTPKPDSAGSQLQLKLDPQAAVPVAYGRTATGGNMVARQTWGSKNAWLGFVAVLSAGGPVQAIESYKAGDYQIGWSTNPTSAPATAVSVGDYGSNSKLYKNKLHQRWQNGAAPSNTTVGAASGQPFALGAMSGLAHAIWWAEWNQDAFPQGMPNSLWVLQGVKLYDPRKDSTYPGGAGSHRRDQPSTWTYSENPYLAALQWTLGRWENSKRVYGIGAKWEEVDVASFVNGANVADANNWKVGGVVTTNDDKFAVLASLLASGGGVPVARGAQIAVSVNAPKTSVLTLTKEDIIGEVEISSTTSWRDRQNTIVPRYREETQNWEIISGERVSAPLYVTEDGGETKTIEVEYPLVQQAAQAHQLATYELCNSREFLTYTVNAKVRFLSARVGDAIFCNVPEIASSNQKCVIVGREYNPADMSVTLSLKSETDAKHAFALGQSQIAPPSPKLDGYDPSNPAAPSELAWSITDTTISNDDATLPVIVVSGATDDPNASTIIVEYRPLGSSTWLNWGEFPRTTTRVEINSLTSGTNYEVAVSYRTNLGVIGARLILSAQAGAMQVDWSNVVSGSNKPQDNATKGAPNGTSVGGRPVEQLLSDTDKAAADAAAAIGAVKNNAGQIIPSRDLLQGIADLKVTYGDTETSKANADAAQAAAALATLAKDNAQKSVTDAASARDAGAAILGQVQSAYTSTVDAKTLTLAARDTSLSARDATTAALALTASARDEANTAKTTAQGAATLSDSARIAAQAASTAALASQGAAATSASTAEGYKTDAGNSASAANASVVAAVAARDAAQGSAGAASTSAAGAAASSDAAGQRATAAQTSAVNASSSYTAANQSVAATFPSDFSQGSKFFTNTPIGQFPPDTTQGAYVNSGGAVYQVSNENAVILAKGYFKAIPGRRYRYTASVRTVTDPTSGTTGFGVDFNAPLGAMFNAAPQLNGYHVSVPGVLNTIAIPASAGWTTIAVDFVASDPANPFNRPRLFTFAPTPAGFVWQVRSLVFEDVTDSVAANVAATAASTSASTASTKADAAGQSAQSASTSANTATTKAGEALSYRNDAAGSASNALGSQQTASSASGVAATAKNAAETARDQAAGSASAAATSASNASSSQYGADQSASAAQTSATNAGTSASNALTYSQNASTSAQTAAGSSSNATSAALVAARSALDAAAASMNDNRSPGSSKGTWSYNDFNTFSPTNRLPTQDYDAFSYVGGAVRVTGTAHVHPVTPTRILAGHRYRATVEFRLITNGAQTGDHYMFCTFWDVNGNLLTGNTIGIIATGPTTVAAGAQRLTAIISWDGAGGSIVWPNGAAYARVMFRTAGGVTTEIDALWLEDIEATTLAQEAATASVGSASTAGTKATAAGQSADAASQSATNASTSASNAQTYASNASTSAQNAAGSASTATVQAGVAAKSALDAGAAALDGNKVPGASPSTWSLNEFNIYKPVGRLPATDTGGISYVAGQLRVSSLAHIHPVTPTRLIAGRRYLASVTFRLITNGTQDGGHNLYVDFFDTNGVECGIINVFGIASTTVAAGFQTLTAVISSNGAGGSITWPANAAYGRVMFRTSGGVTTEVTSVYLEDTEAKLAAQEAATASAGSASTATTKASEAGQSAQAASGSATAAGTKAGEASTSASQASSSASDALGSKNSAASSAGVAATARDDANTAKGLAQGSATAAATSASQASSSKDAAGQSASSASTSATTAITKAGEASTSASNASTSASNAAGSSQTATTQAGLAAQSKTDAGNSASAAAGSASTASTKASESGSSAAASAASALSAQGFKNDASGNASLAAGSASTASTKADAANNSAITANTNASNAAVYRDQANTYAGQSLTSANNASASAAAASLSNTIASSYSSSAFNKNDKFASWPGAATDYPTFWNGWAAGGNYRIDRQTGIGSPYGLKTLLDTPNVDGGFAQGVPVHNGYWVMEVTARLDGNNWFGAGCSLDGRWSIDFARHPDSNGLISATGVGATRTWSVMFKINGEVSGTVNLYGMHAWSGFGSSDPRYMTWFMLRVRPANQNEINANKALADSAANSSAITSLQSTSASQGSSLATLTTTVAARALGGGNMLTNTDFVSSNGIDVSGWNKGYTGAGPEFGINIAGDAWRLPNENNIAIHQNGQAGGSNYQVWATNRIAVTPGGWIQAYCYMASHRSKTQFVIYWQDGAGSVVGAATSEISTYTADNGGQNLQGWRQQGLTATQVPANAVAMSIELRKYDTLPGYSDSYAWFCRPYVGLSRPGVTEWNAYAPGSGSAVQTSLLASVTTQASAIADAAGKLQAYMVNEVSAGDGRAIVSLRANGQNGSSNIDLAASQIRLLTPGANNGYTTALSVDAGEAVFAGKLRVGVNKTGARTVITDAGVKIYDANGVLRVNLSS